ncbi:hypothetical protein [Pedobacter mucosus]|uniref:hypothetical protein n=1 Tax=Pedobacter mucosus TaxID=2895286 RepID=UPI001EE46CB7|nr:hypothetical protein [Pedobacter mucosus]UKT64850.1 hypothetical protein LOK61_03535 [Pedobacter mucosus]
MEPKIRKIAMVANRVNLNDEDELDVLFWLNQPVLERLKTVVSLRKHYFTWLNGSFPDKISKVVSKRKL